MPDVGYGLVGPPGLQPQNAYPDFLPPSTKLTSASYRSPSPGQFWILIYSILIHVFTGAGVGNRFLNISVTDASTQKQYMSVGSSIAQTANQDIDYYCSVDILSGASRTTLQLVRLPRLLIPPGMNIDISAGPIVGNDAANFPQIYCYLYPWGQTSEGDSSPVLPLPI